MITTFGITACTNVAAFKKKARAGRGKGGIVNDVDEVLFFAILFFLFIA